MAPFFPLRQLRGIPGFERARYADPYSGGIGNSMRYFNMSRNDASRSKGSKTCSAAAKRPACWSATPRRS